MEKISPPDFVWVRGCGAWWSLLWNFGGIFKEEHKSKHFADLSPQTSPHTYTTFFTQKLCRTLHRQNFASYLHLATKHVVSMGPYTNMHVHRRKPGNTWTKIKNTFFTLTSFCRNFGLNNEHDKNDDDDDDDDHDDDADGQASNCPNKHHRYPVSSWPNCWGKLPKFLVNQLPLMPSTGLSFTARLRRHGLSIPKTPVRNAMLWRLCAGRGPFFSTAWGCYVLPGSSSCEVK